MNDNIFIWLILMGIVYILPEILGKNKKRKSGGKYQYPQFPDSTQVPTGKKPQTTQQTQQPRKPAADYPGFGYEYYSPPAKTVQQEVFRFTPQEAAPTAVTLPPPVNVPSSVTSGASPWQGVLSPQVLANAVVFSEIILPPRAHRPFGRNYGGKPRR